jgi:hypothetical protein
LAHVDQHNEAIIKGENAGPTVALAPLPSGAQFLNVIESVFSGMARAIIARSNYVSTRVPRIITAKAGRALHYHADSAARGHGPPA